MSETEERIEIVGFETLRVAGKAIPPDTPVEVPAEVAMDLIKRQKAVKYNRQEVENKGPDVVITTKDLEDAERRGIAKGEANIRSQMETAVKAAKAEGIEEGKEIGRKAAEEAAVASANKAKDTGSSKPGDATLKANIAQQNSEQNGDAKSQAGAQQNNSGK